MLAHQLDWLDETYYLGLSWMDTVPEYHTLTKTLDRSNLYWQDARQLSSHERH